MTRRTTEDRLREEYFALLPDVRRVAYELDALIRHSLLGVSRKLAHFEQLVIRSRVKDCESAVQSLRRRQEGGTFDPDRAEPYTLTALKDLAGVRVLAFPFGLVQEANEELQNMFRHWRADPVLDEYENTLAFKYHGFCGASDSIQGEYQVVSLLTGLYWEVEHAALYKPEPQLRGLARSRAMQARDRDVLRSLRAFEEEFESMLKSSTESRD